MSAVEPLRPVSLEDKYALPSGSVLMSGTQVLVRLPLLQRAVDQAAGLNTAGFVTGYRGSPLGAYDMELWAEQRRLKEAHVVFQPGVNEDLAATAVWGTQQAPLLPGTKYDGIFAIWYGKGPGVDRSGDVFKHGNRQGASKHGGVLVCAGDDHPGKSSTVSHQSEQALAASHIPVLYPASVQELLEYGMLGWALSRFCGLWVALKCTNETVEGTSTVDIDPARFRFAAPSVTAPPTGLNTNPRPMALREADEMLVTRYRLPAAHAFARANGIDRVVIDGPQRRLGIVATGKGYAETVQALQALGLDDAGRAAQLGLRLYKVGMIWPVEPRGLREFAAGHDEILFVEEKAAFVEEQAGRILYSLPEAERPRLTGKFDDQDRALLPADQQLQFAEVALVLARRLEALGLVDDRLRERVAQLQSHQSQARDNAAGPASRSPYFCSGCPHNTSTVVPEGSLALAGIGCHTMAGYMNRRTLMPTQMGGEGLNWTGIAPFSAMPHVFQNLGDGTYFHSGLLAVRGAVAAGVNITYKMLYNDAVAMTGGQPVEGHLSPVEIARQLLAERVKRVVIVSEDPARYRAASAACRPKSRCTIVTNCRHCNSNCASCRASPRSSTSRPARPKNAAAASAANIRTREARVDQRRGLRRLRRLLGAGQLRVHPAEGDRIRPQARDRPVELQQGLQLREGLLPVVRDRARWAAAQAGRCEPGPERAGEPAAAARSRTDVHAQLERARDRHRWHRRGDRRVRARDGRAPRGQAGERDRHDRARPEERRRLEPLAHIPVSRSGTGGHGARG